MTTSLHVVVVGICKIHCTTHNLELKLECHLPGFMAIVLCNVQRIYSKTADAHFLSRLRVSDLTKPF